MDEKAIYQAGLDNGRKKGIEQGIKKGISKGKEEIVKKLIEKKMSIEDIAEITGLSIERIEQLKLEIS